MIYYLIDKYVFVGFNYVWIGDLVMYVRNCVRMLCHWLHMVKLNGTYGTVWIKNEKEIKYQETEKK